MSSVAGFWRVKRWEKSIRATSNPRAVTTEDIERDVAIGRNIESVFGNGYPEEEQSMVRQDVLLTEALAEARLTRDLRAAGLI